MDLEQTKQMKDTATDLSAVELHSRVPAKSENLQLVDHSLCGHQQRSCTSRDEPCSRGLTDAPLKLR